MPKAIVITEPGGPEVLRLRDIDPGAPGPGELRVRQTALGVNFHDVYGPLQSACPLFRQERAGK